MPDEMKKHPSRITVVLATRNQHKIKEIREILQGEKVELLFLSSFPDMADVTEDGVTFLENAKKKAYEVHLHTGLPALADDSGLEVDFLNGRPGIRSSRFAGEHADAEQNNTKLLDMLKGIEEAQRAARFRCVVVLADQAGFHHVEGVCEGRITTALSGKKGFGYDPLFFYPPYGKTFAEITQSEKNTVSHRGIAFRKAAAMIQELYPKTER
jgi:XTP/dITP diphosphohydrolase